MKHQSTSTSAREDDTTGTHQWLDPSRPLRSSVPRRRHGRTPHLLLGVLLVVVCAGGAVWSITSAQDRVPVLALSHPVTVGHVLSKADLHSVDVSASPGVALVPAGQASTVLGRPTATSLGRGALLTPDAVGPAAVPEAGHAVVAVGVQPGQFPPALAAGTRVTVVVMAGTTAAATTATTTGQAQGTSWSATVVGVAPAGTDQTTVVSLELLATNAAELAQVPPGQLALVMQPARGGR